MASVANSSTSICGIDVGSENCYVAVARAGGIEILLNEYSQRSTPAYIAFGGNQRELGVSAKQKQMMNLKNTCFAPSLIVGKSLQELLELHIPNKLEEENGQVLISVYHDGEEQKYTPTQILAMLFTKLRQISGNVIDCVINCPNYFTEAQKRALSDAAVISGLNPLKIIPDMTAVALYYGFYRSGGGTQDASIVAFVDCGHTSTQASIVLFNHKENSMRVLDAEYQANIGGKHFDEVLANHFIKQKNLKLNDRARYRLIAECEKLKKQMSANSNELPINIECLYEDRDFSARIDRTAFEDLSSELLQNINAMLVLTRQRAEQKFEKEFGEKFGKFRIDSVEVVGGTSRIPKIKQMIRDTFGHEPSTTLNADEAVARGCALQCAILSPTFKVAKELQIIDSLPYQVNFRYRIANAPDFKLVDALYPRGHQFPFTKQVSIACQALPIEAEFEFLTDDGKKVPLAGYQIKQPEGVNLSEVIGKNPVKVRVRADSNGLISIIAASITSEKPDSKPNELMDQSEENEKMETDENNVEQPTQTANTPASNTGSESKRKTKVKTETIELIVVPLYIAGKLSKEDVQKFLEIESNLILADKNWKEKTDAKNALEEFIYEWRDRLETGSYDVFINTNDKEKFLAQLRENENWLYQQDEEEKMHSKSVYDERTNAMADAFGKKVLNRKRDFENRPRLLEQLGQRIQQARKLAEKNDPDEKEEVEKFNKDVGEKATWFDQSQGRLMNYNTVEDPPIWCDEISAQLKEVESLITKLHNSRTRREEQKRKAAEAAAKKAAEEKKQAEAAAAASAGDVSGAKTNTGEPTENGPNSNNTTATTPMDVDEQNTTTATST